MNTTAKVFIGATIGLALGFVAICAITWLVNLIVRMST